VTELTAPACELCESPGGTVLWRDALLRIVAVEGQDYPGFCRVVLERHVAEMTELADDEREAVMRAVFAVEAALRALMSPDKINLASLGNVVPHLHWHVIPRFRDDPHFPSAIWAAARRPARAVRRVDERALAAALAARLGAGDGA
jgi:diadenosine tetraphosphate (Ap4A) HIT family hydrolase